MQGLVRRSAGFSLTYEGTFVRTLTVPEKLKYIGINPELADDDAMFDGRDEHYLEVGQSASRAIRRALRGAPVPQRILDLPCGHGRVTRVLRAMYPDASITVCDIDQSGVDFTAKHFNARGIYSQADFRALALAETYDLIWVGSLITHLPEQDTRRFFDFAARHLAPEGTLVITSHGSFVAERLLVWNYGLTDDAVRGLLADHWMHGYGYRAYPGAEGYGISLARRAWYEDLFAAGPLRLDRYEAQGWDDHQDVLVVRRRNAASVRVGGFWPRVFGFAPAPSAPLAAYDTAGLSAIPADKQAVVDRQQVTGFDEDWYLAFDPLVARAVAEGQYKSGFDHYCHYGWREARPICDASLGYDARPRRRDSAAEKLDEAGRASRVSRVWSTQLDEQADSGGWYWMAHPMVRDRLNYLASGDPRIDAYGRLAILLRDMGWTLPVARSISLGCGFGALERDLAARRLIDRVDGYDLAQEAIAGARRQAEQAGLTNLRYHVADLETADLPAGKIDIVLAHQSVHHIERLEQIFARVHRALRPGGLFHLHEFVGPIRFQWTDAQIGLVNEFLDSLPEVLRRLPSGKPKPRQGRATVAAMIEADPSEAIRSSEIEPVLRQSFKIVEIRRLGGSLAHLVLADIAQNFLPQNEEHRAMLQRLFDMEDRAMSDGVVGSDFAVITAMKE
jgi:SAM-dependent methyltransferase